MAQKNSQKMNAIVVDPLDDFGLFVFTPEKIGWLMELFARTGFQRVYWYSYVPHTGWFRDVGLWPLLKENLRNVPNHEQLAVKYARENGLEIYSVFKPYEGFFGGHSFVPGSENDRKYGLLDRIGGRLTWGTDFVAQNPQLRLKRRMDDIPKDIATRIIDRIEVDKNDNHLSGLTREDIQVYVSKDNAKYERYQGSYSFSEAVVDALVIDYFGRQLNTETGKTSRIVIDGLAIGPEWPFVAVSAGKKREQFQFIPKTMCRVYDDQGRQIPVTYACHNSQRDPNRETHADHGFEKYGFQFDAFNREMGIFNVYFLTGFRQFEFGIARGVNEYLSGVLCEAYPQVQDHWLSRVNEILETGVDGIDIRLTNHSGYSQDPFAYGFNEPILQEYRSEVGADQIACDPITLMRLRGRIFTRFLTKAAHEVHARGKRLQLHVISQYVSGDICGLASHTQTSIWPDWELWVRQIADAITFRDFQNRHYHADIGKTIKQFARRCGKEVWMPCYLTMSGGNLRDSYMRAIQADPDITGILFYEAGGEYEERSGGFEWLPDKGELLRRFLDPSKR